MLPPVLAYPIAALLSPAVSLWLIHAEHRILQSGIPLSPTLLADAIRIGIDSPEKIRTLVVEKIPAREGRLTRFAQRHFPQGFAHPVALTAQYGIYLTPSCHHHHETLLHELVHVRQYQNLGSPLSFLFHYIAQCLIHGYWGAPLEQEARQVARVLNTSP